MAILAECRAYRKKQAGKKSGVFLRRGLTTRADFGPPGRKDGKENGDQKRRARQRSRLPGQRRV